MVKEGIGRKRTSREKTKSRLTRIKTFDAERTLQESAR